MSNNPEFQDNMEGEMEGEDENGEVFDDDYLLALHKYLQEKKKQRKQAEQDVNLLDGRLRCLRDEQRKEDFKIAVTRKKTEKKKAAIEQSQEEMLKKMEFKNMKDKMENNSVLYEHIPAEKFAFAQKRLNLGKSVRNSVYLIGFILSI